MLTRGDWNLTYTGKQFYFDDPRPEDICIEDIAHALSLQCRFNGHCRHHYSVAQHSIYVSQLVDPQNALLGLLHDAPEAFLGDVVSPFKAMLEDYGGYETDLMEVMAEKFGLDMSDDAWADVKRADMIMLATELRDLTNTPLEQTRCKATPLGVKIIQQWVPEYAEMEFLERFYQLCGK